MAVLRSLPSCDRCRSLKKRCDTQIPACTNCARFGVECIFFDHILNEKVSRRYIDSLVCRLKHDAPGPSLQCKAQPDYYCVNVESGFRLMGPHALLATARVDVSTLTSVTCVQDPRSCPLPELYPGVDVSPQMHQFLVEEYLSVCHPAYPILENDTPFLYDRSAPDNGDDWVRFAFNMVLALGCHCLPKNDTRLLLLSESSYNAAQMHFERVMTEWNVQALQGVLLLAVYSLFDPQKGNVGQQIAFAHRLEPELTEREGEGLDSTLCRLRRVTFCLGTQVSTVLDRSVGFNVADLDDDMGIDSTDEASYVYALYMTQASASQQRDDAAPISTELRDSSWSPLVRIAAYETGLLLKPDLEAASRLLKAYVDNETVLNVLTPHWTFKATITLLSGCPNQERSEHFALGILILERCALKWPNTEALLVALRNFMTSVTWEKSNSLLGGSYFPSG